MEVLLPKKEILLPEGTSIVPLNWKLGLLPSISSLPSTKPRREEKGYSTALGN